MTSLSTNESTGVLDRLRSHYPELPSEGTPAPQQTGATSSSLRHEVDGQLQAMHSSLRHDMSVEFKRVDGQFQAMQMQLREASEVGLRLEAKLDAILAASQAPASTRRQRTGSLPSISVKRSLSL